MVETKQIDEGRKLMWKCRNCENEVEVSENLLKRVKGIVYCSCCSLTKQNMILVKKVSEKK